MFPLDGQADQDTGRPVRSRPPVRNELVGVWLKAEVAVCLWSLRNLSLKGVSEVCSSHMYQILLCRHYELSLPSDILLVFVRHMFSLLSGEICYVNPSDGGLGLPCVEVRRHTLRISYIHRMCMQLD